MLRVVAHGHNSHPRVVAHGHNSHPRVVAHGHNHGLYVRAVHHHHHHRAGLRQPTSRSSTPRISRIDHEGLDQVELGEAIEQAEAARTEHRAVAKSRSSSVNGRHQTALQARARREHRAFGAPGGPGPRIEQPPPADPIADAAARRQRGLENAAMMGYHPDPENPSMLIGPGGLRIPFHADSTTGPELPDDHTGGEE